MSGQTTPVISVCYLRDGQTFVWVFTPERRQATQRSVTSWAAMEFMCWTDAARILTCVREAQVGRSDPHPGCEGVAWATTLAMPCGVVS